MGGTLESEHPIIKYLGVYPCESLVKYSGSKANRSWMNLSLFSNIFLYYLWSFIKSSLNYIVFSFIKYFYIKFENYIHEHGNEI